jgi:hypothetical protein
VADTWHACTVVLGHGANLKLHLPAADVKAANNMMEARLAWFTEPVTRGGCILPALWCLRRPRRNYTDERCNACLLSAHQKSREAPQAAASSGPCGCALSAWPAPSLIPNRTRA